MRLDLKTLGIVSMWLGTVCGVYSSVSSNSSFFLAGFFLALQGLIFFVFSKNSK